MDSPCVEDLSTNNAVAPDEIDATGFGRDIVREARALKGYGRTSPAKDWGEANANAMTDATGRPRLDQ